MTYISANRFVTNLFKNNLQIENYLLIFFWSSPLPFPCTMSKQRQKKFLKMFGLWNMGFKMVCLLGGGWGSKVGGWALLGVAKFWFLFIKNHIKTRLLLAWKPIFFFIVSWFLLFHVLIKKKKLLFLILGTWKPGYTGRP